MLWTATSIRSSQHSQWTGVVGVVVRNIWRAPHWLPHLWKIRSTGSCQLSAVASFTWWESRDSTFPLSSLLWPWERTQPKPRSWPSRQSPAVGTEARMCCWTHTCYRETSLNPTFNLMELYCSTRLNRGIRKLLLEKHLEKITAGGVHEDAFASNIIFRTLPR